MSDTVLNIPKTELARKTRQVLRSVQQGQTVMVESYGQPEAAIIDITDYRILRAALNHYSHPVDANDAATLTTEQHRFNLVIGNYLAESISLSRAAELLGLTGLDLRTRLMRLDLPLRTVPDNEDEALDDIQTALDWTTPNS